MEFIEIFRLGAPVTGNSKLRPERPEVEKKRRVVEVPEEFEPPKKKVWDSFSKTFML